MNDPNWKMALWIADEIQEDPEDVYDVLIGNITEPKELVNAVEGCKTQYDSNKKSGRLFR